MNPTLPPLLLRELPEDLRRHTLEQLVQEGSRDLCGRLYERCLLLFGSGNCGANDPIWRQACERFGLRRLSAADWHATFQELCRSLNTLDRNTARLMTAEAFTPDEHLAGIEEERKKRTLDTFFLYVQGRAKEVDVKVELDTLRFLSSVSETPGMSLIREAFLGLGAVEYPTYAALSNLRNAFESGNVDAVRAAIGTSVNAGVHELWHLVSWIGDSPTAGGFFGGGMFQTLNTEITVEEHLQWIRLLLEAGVRTDAVMDGETLLVRALTRRSLQNWAAHTRVVHFLLEHGVDPNDGGPRNAPLAALVNNAQLNFFTEMGFAATPSAKHAFMKRSRLLLDYGADPTLPVDGINGRTALAKANFWRDTYPNQREFWNAYIDLLHEYAERA